MSEEATLVLLLMLDTNFLNEEEKNICVARISAVSERYSPCGGYSQLRTSMSASLSLKVHPAHTLLLVPSPLIPSACFLQLVRA